MIFLSEYTINKNKFCTQFFAENWEHANHLASKRNINEKVSGTTDSFTQFDETIFDDLKSEKLLHLLCFASWINIKSGNTSIDEVLSDTGILHELIHVRSKVNTLLDINSLKNRIKSFIYQAFNYPRNQIFER